MIRIDEIIAICHFREVDEKLVPREERTVAKGRHRIIGQIIERKISDSGIRRELMVFDRIRSNLIFRKEELASDKGIIINLLSVVLTERRIDVFALCHAFSSQCQIGVDIVLIAIAIDDSGAETIKRKCQNAARKKECESTKERMLLFFFTSG